MRDIEADFRNARGNKAQKKKIRELMERYGNSREEIEAKSSMGEWFEFVLANGDALWEEVRREKLAEEAQNKAYDQMKARIEAAKKTREEDEVVEEDEEEEEVEEDSAAALKNSLTPHTPVQKENSFINELKKTAEDDRFGIAKALNVQMGEKSNMPEFDEENFMNVMKPIIKKHEGIVLHPYVDTADKVTVGPGINVDANDEGVEWHLLDRKTNTLRKLDLSKAEDRAIRDAELAKLKKYQKNNKKGAGFFTDITDLRITEKNADTLYRNRVQGSINDVNAIIKEFNENLGEQEGYIEPFEKQPQNIQIVLIDMVYNLGRTGFDWKQTEKKLESGDIKKIGYPSFWEGIAHRNVDEMLKECIRNRWDVKFAARNKAIQELIKQTPESWTKKALKK